MVQTGGLPPTPDSLSLELTTVPQVAKVLGKVQNLPPGLGCPIQPGNSLDSLKLSEWVLGPGGTKEFPIYPIVPQGLL